MAIKVGIVSTSRADFSIYAPLVVAMDKSDFFNPSIIAMGSHLLEEFGNTINDLKKYDCPVLVPKDNSFELDDSSFGVAKNSSFATAGMAEVLKDNSFDLIISLGDRFEMLAAVLAAVPFDTPIAHLHGGETTMGAMDNKFRHAVTLLSDFHITSCEKYREKVVSMGIPEDQALNSGSLAVENMKNMPLLTSEEIKEKFDIDVETPFVLSTFHPETMGNKDPLEDLEEYLAAIDDSDLNWVLTLGNIDTYGIQYRERMKEFSEKNKDKLKTFTSLGMEGYYSVLKHAHIVVGNSSSGIIEAATYHIPTVNIGNRQEGRETSENTITVPTQRDQISEGIRQAQKMCGQKFNNIYEQENSTQKNARVFAKINDRQ